MRLICYKNIDSPFPNVIKGIIVLFSSILINHSNNPILFNKNKKILSLKNLPLLSLILLNLVSHKLTVITQIFRAALLFVVLMPNSIISKSALKLNSIKENS